VILRDRDQMSLGPGSSLEVATAGDGGAKSDPGTGLDEFSLGRED